MKRAYQHRRAFWVVFFASSCTGVLCGRLSAGDTILGFILTSEYIPLAIVFGVTVNAMLSIAADPIFNVVDKRKAEREERRQARRLAKLLPRARAIKRNRE